MSTCHFITKILGSIVGRGEKNISFCVVYRFGFGSAARFKVEAERRGACFSFRQAAFVQVGCLALRLVNYDCPVF